MRILIAMTVALVCTALAAAQDTFTVTGTAIPATLLKKNYGSLPKGIVGYDLTICNASEQKQPVVNSQVYQALVASSGEIMPVGSQILLGSILSSRRRNVLSMVTLGLDTAVGVFAVMSASKRLNPSPGMTVGVGVASISLQELTTVFGGVPAAARLQKYEADVLPPALVLDAHSCVEKTLFAVTQKPDVKPAALAFHIK